MKTLRERREGQRKEKIKQLLLKKYEELEKLKISQKDKERAFKLYCVELVTNCKGQINILALVGIAYLVLIGIVLLCMF